MVDRFWSVSVTSNGDDTVKTRRFKYSVLPVLAATFLVPGISMAANEAVPADDVLMRAMVDELARAMTLQMEDLEKPYFIQFNAEDGISYTINARFGAIISSDVGRQRSLSSNTRIGSYELDNTNFSSRRAVYGGASYGANVNLPIEDDYMALRQAIWRGCDQDYKSSVERLTRKRAYLKDKNIEDRPDDFTRESPVVYFEPVEKIEFDQKAWEDALKKVSARLKKYERVQDSDVTLMASSGTTYVVNSEGTRVRTSGGAVLLVVTAEGQAEDGMRFSDYCRYFEKSVDDLPSVEKMIGDVDQMANRLYARMDAPVLEQYTGPVLFEGVASCQVFRSLLSDGIAGKIDPIGVSRQSVSDIENLDRKLGLRILPRSFSVYDDPTVEKLGESPLMGSYHYDDDGVKARKVELVSGGKLKDMVMCRVPTKKLSGSNGHGRRGSRSNVSQSQIGCLFIEDKDGVPDKELREELIEAAKDEGLDFALRVTAIRSPDLGASRQDLRAYFTKLQQGGSPLGDPVVVYRVYADTNKPDELVRGVEFGSVEFRSLKRILAAGSEPAVYNYVGLGYGGTSPSSSIVAPSVVFEEMDVSKIEQEHDKLPILKSPLSR